MKSLADNSGLFSRPSMSAMARLMAFAAVVVCLLMAGYARAADVVIVPSSNAQPYQEADAVLTKELVRQGHTVLTLPLDDITEEELQHREKTKHAFVAIGTKAAVWLNERLSDHSLLVYCMVSDPESQGLTQRLQTCGISTQVPAAKQLELIAEALPKTRTVGMLYNSESRASRSFAQQVRQSLPASWRLRTINVEDYKTPAEAVQALFRTERDVVLVNPDASTYNSATIRALLLAALRNKTPVFGFSTPFVRAGALLGTGIDPRTQALDTAALTDDLLKRETPLSKSEKHRAPRYHIAVNLIVAEQLGIKLPEALVSRARDKFTRSPGEQP